MKKFKMSPVPDFNIMSDVPMGSSCPSFHITEKNAGWRVNRPVADPDKCVDCYRCYLVCPDGAIHREMAKEYRVDYDFCKGCGICAYECRVKAITMVKEGTK